MKMHPPRPPRAHRRGFSLIEVMISILIFSLGVLAMVALQANSIRLSSDAKYRSDASQLVNTLLGRMWVSDRTNATLQTFAPGGAGYTPWVAEVQAALPLAAASAPSVSVTTNNVVTVTVYWKAPGEALAGRQHEYTAIAQVR